MQRWQGLDDVPGDWGCSVVTIGVFDGVHRGHQHIVGRAAEAAARLGLPVVVITFDPHPMEVVRPGSHPPLLCTVRRRVSCWASEGCDAVCVLPFTLDFSRLGPDELRPGRARRPAARPLGRGGGQLPVRPPRRRRRGLLAELGEKYDFGAEGVPLLTEHGVTISSSGIRDLLNQGDVAGAAADLGRAAPGGGGRGARPAARPGARLPDREPRDRPEYRYPRRWRVRGLAGQPGPRRPRRGTLARRHLGGHQPDVRRREQTVEAYALDRDDLDLYGRHMAVDFAARLRGMVRFDSADELAEQMRRDVDQARDLVGGGTA